MKLLLFLLLIAYGCCQCNSARNGRPNVGRFVEQISNVPYQATIRGIRKYNDIMTEELVVETYHICGASIVSRFWILSAAQCTIHFTVDEIVIQTGTQYANESGTLHEIDLIRIHEDYDFLTHSNDICLIKLKHHISFDVNRQPIAVGKLTDAPNPGDVILISGFGLQGVKNISLAPWLKSVALSVVYQVSCSYESDVFCADSFANSTYFDDYGSPAVKDDKLIGIVSPGYLSRTVHGRAVLTAIFKHHEWIAKFIRAKN